MRKHSNKKQKKNLNKNSRKLGGVGEEKKSFFDTLADQAKEKALEEIKKKGLAEIKSNPAVSELTKFLPQGVIDKIQPEEPKPEQPNVIVIDNKKEEPKPEQPNIIVVGDKKEEPKPEQPNIIVVGDKGDKEEKDKEEKDKEENDKEENDKEDKSMFSKMKNLIKSSENKNDDVVKLNGNDYVEGTCLFTGAKGLFPKSNTLTIKKDDFDKEIIKEEVKNELKEEKKGGKKNKTQKKGGVKKNKSKTNSKKKRSKK